MKLFLTLTRIFLTLSLAGAIITWVFISILNMSLPDYHQLENYDPKVVSRLYAQDGRLMSEFGEEKRMFIPIKAIPKTIIQAFIAAEDQHFYSHHGIDPIGIIRAAYNNYYKKRGERLSGGSTITQQVAKNFLLNNEKSFIRKIKEALLALRIEKAMPKEKILELYLNQIFLGRNSYGVAAAALNYFNKSLDELTTDEAAFIAGLPKAPSTYNPFYNKARAIGRRNWVLDRMETSGFITADQAQKYKTLPLNSRPRPLFDFAFAPYFSEEVRRQLVKDYGKEQAYSKGLMVRTTLVPKFQEIIDRHFQKHIERFDRQRGWRGPIRHYSVQELRQKPLRKLLRRLEKEYYHPRWMLAFVLNPEKDVAHIVTEAYGRATIPLENMNWARTFSADKNVGPKLESTAGALQKGDLIWVEREEKETGESYHLRQIPLLSGGAVLMDPFTGRVLAMTGGYNYKYSQFNRATQAQRQAGSAIKTFIYLTAFEKGYTPAHSYTDEEISLHTLEGEEEWSPHNYHENFAGEMPLRKALEKSNNIIPIKLVRDMGLGAVLRTLKKFSINPNPEPNLAVVLGAVETSLINMVSAYSSLLNGGKKVVPSLVDWVEDKRGKVLGKDTQMTIDDSTQTSDAPPKVKSIYPHIVSPESAYQVVSILEGAVKRGSSWRGRIPQHPTGAKTGTTNNFKDAWFIGFTADLVLGVFVGYDQPTGMGEHATGSAMAGPIFHDCMEEIVKHYPPTPFRVPPNVKRYKVNYHTGSEAAPEDEQTIFETFKPGTEAIIYRQQKKSSRRR